MLYKLFVVRLLYRSLHAELASPSHAAFLILLVLLLAWLTGCAGLASYRSGKDDALRHLAVKLRLAPGAADATLSYRDACGESQNVPLGPLLEDTLVTEMSRLFQHVYVEGTSQEDPAADRTIEVGSGLKELVVFVAGKNKQRYPATVTLSANVSSFDASGAGLEQLQPRAHASGDVRTDRVSCEVHGIGSLVQKAVDDLAKDFGGRLLASTRFLQGVGVVQPGTGAVSEEPTALGQESSSDGGEQALTEPPTDPDGTSAVLSFRAILNDENQNQVLEGGERLDLEVKVSNTGGSPAHEVWVILSGSPVLIEHRPNPSRVGDLQPGETKSAKVSGELASISGQGEAELVMSLTASSPAVEYPRGKQFRVPVRPGTR